MCLDTEMSRPPPTVRAKEVSQLVGNLPTSCGKVAVEAVDASEQRVAKGLEAGVVGHAHPQAAHAVDSPTQINTSSSGSFPWGIAVNPITHRERSRFRPEGKVDRSLSWRHRFYLSAGLLLSPGGKCLLLGWR